MKADVSTMTRICDAVSISWKATHRSGPAAPNGVIQKKFRVEPFHLLLKAENRVNLENGTSISRFVSRPRE
jgi:hypothetical protein